MDFILPDVSPLHASRVVDKGKLKTPIIGGGGEALLLYK